MRKLSILLIILFVSCQAPTSGVSETDSNTFEQNVQTIKDTWIQGFEEENLEKAISFMADSIKWTGPNGDTVGMESLKQSIQYWMETFDEMTYSEGDGLPGTDAGFWGGNTYPVSQAMSGPNNVRMYGTWSMKNTASGKTAKTKHYAVLTFNEDGKVHTATEYASFDEVRNSFE
ncbi:MAG: hypothetical protein ACJ0OM_01730 [Candidatus Marisimplicoccus sp.]